MMLKIVGWMAVSHCINLWFLYYTLIVSKTRVRGEMPHVHYETVYSVDSSNDNPTDFKQSASHVPANKRRCAEQSREQRGVSRVRNTGDPALLPIKGWREAESTSTATSLRMLSEPTSPKIRSEADRTLALGGEAIEANEVTALVSHNEKVSDNEDADEPDEGATTSSSVTILPVTDNVEGRTRTFTLFPATTSTAEIDILLILFASTAGISTALLIVALVFYAHNKPKDPPPTPFRERELSSVGGPRADGGADLSTDRTSSHGVYCAQAQPLWLAPEAPSMWQQNSRLTVTRNDKLLSTQAIATVHVEGDSFSDHSDDCETDSYSSLSDNRLSFSIHNNARELSASRSVSPGDSDNSKLEVGPEAAVVALSPAQNSSSQPESSSPSPQDAVVELSEPHR